MDANAQRPILSFNMHIKGHASYDFYKTSKYLRVHNIIIASIVSNVKSRKCINMERCFPRFFITNPFLLREKKRQNGRRCVLVGLCLPVNFCILMLLSFSFSSIHTATHSSLIRLVGVRYLFAVIDDKRSFVGAYLALTLFINAINR